MAESNYISIPTTESNTNSNKSANENRGDDKDIMTLKILTEHNNEIVCTSRLNSFSATTTATTKRLFYRKPRNLHVNISSVPVETDNDNLSTATIAVTSHSNSNSTNTPSTSTTTNTSNTTISHDKNERKSKKLNIGFENLSFTVRTGIFRSDTKHILKDVTGYFKAGEFSAILGPSGAGKSTCLNILSGYKTHGYSGEVKVNGHVREIKAFKSHVAFITQDTSLHAYLTVKEAMHFSATLKIGTHISKSARKERVKKILEAIGMYDNRHTRTSQLSGGQKKRLSIALELVNNPLVLVMDEPTTGLDSSISNQLISLLKKLALEGRTVICTIHQPSAITFEMFDHLYALARGSCIYSGSAQNLVPFLAEMGLQCPGHYNPADYLMEIATDDYGPQNDKLIAKIENGRNDIYRQTNVAKRKQLQVMQKVDKMIAACSMTPVNAPLFTPTVKKHNSSPTFISPGTGKTSTNCSHPMDHLSKPLTSSKEMPSSIANSNSILNKSTNDSNSSNDNSCCQPIESPKLCKSENVYATPFYRQLGILLLRTFLILWRDKSLAMMRFIIHLITALIIGFLYYGIGNKAENALNTFRYCFYSIMFIMYSAFSAIVVKFPLEFPIVSREHFNRWYSLRAYYIAITLADIPIQLACITLYIVITYILTDQPLDFFRVVLFCLIIFLTALVGQSIGLAVGASLNIKLAVTLGPFFICPFLIFSGFFLQERHAPELLKNIFKVSFLKYSLDGSMVAIFGFDRPRLECTAIYCHYSRPQMFLKDIDMLNANYKTSIIYLICLFLFLRLISFYIMSFRLRLFR